MRDYSALKLWGIMEIRVEGGEEFDFDKLGERGIRCMQIQVGPMCTKVWLQRFDQELNNQSLIGSPSPPICGKPHKHTRANERRKEWLTEQRMEAAKERANHQAVGVTATRAAVRKAGRAKERAAVAETAPDGKAD